MKLVIVYSLLAIFLLKKASCTHLETCECHEIERIVSTTIEQALAGLQYNFSLEINRAISKINTTDVAVLSRLETSVNLTMSKIFALENGVKDTIVQLIDPIQRQLDYHLPPPPAVLLQRNFSQGNPAESCKDIYENDPSTPSGYYWIRTNSGPIKAYCKMDSNCGNMTGGWMRVAHLDMTNSSHQCPNGMTLVSRSSAPRRLCDITYSGCASKNYTVYGK